MQAYLSHKHYLAILPALIIFSTLLAGCATKAEPSAQGAFVDTMVAPLAKRAAWTVTRDVLLEMEDIEIYTRDERGLFVVYANQHRRKVFVPHRTMLTITLTSETDASTKIAIETIHQKYSVTMLTHPTWRDQSDASTDSTGVEILETIKSRISRMQ